MKYLLARSQQLKNAEKVDSKHTLGGSCALTFRTCSNFTSPNRGNRNDCCCNVWLAHAPTSSQCNVDVRPGTCSELHFHVLPPAADGRDGVIVIVTEGICHWQSCCESFGAPLGILSVRRRRQCYMACVDSHSTGNLTILYVTGCNS